MERFYCPRRFQMDLTREMLEHFADFTPNDTAVYHVENGALITLFLSENIPSLLSMTREEYLKITEKDAMDLTIPQDRAGLAAATLSCIRTGEPFSYFYRVFHNTRGFDWVHVSAHVCGSLEGSPLIIAQFANMTKEGDIYQKILNTSDRLAMILDRNTHEILYANEVAMNSGASVSHSLLNQTCFGFLYGRKTPCRDCVMLHAEENGFFERIDYDKTSEKWKEINVRSIVWCNHDAFLLYIKDITNLKNTEFEALKSKQMYDDAAQSAKLVIWTYYPDRHEVVMMNSGYTREICSRFNIPGKIENVPESLVKYVNAKDRDIFLSIYEKIDRGEPTAEGEFRYQLPGQSTEQYERMTFRRITDEDGRLLSVHCCGQNISLEKKAQEEYDLIRRQLTGNTGEAVGSFELNLTANRCLSGSSSYPDVENDLNRPTADEHFSAAADSIIDPQIKKNFLRIFNCAHLIDTFNKGHKEISINYPLRSSHGGTMWIHGTLYMMLNPKTEEIEAISYCTDVTKKKREEEIIYSLIREDCDYLGIIDTEENTFELHKGIWDQEDIAVGATVDYDILRHQVSSKYLTHEEAEALIAATEIPVLKKELDAKTKFTVTYNCINPEDGRYSLKKQITFSWLNNDKKEIIAIQSDVTEAYRKEQERIETLEKASLEAKKANRAKTEFLSRMSHDIRTPLNGIMGMTYIAQKQENPAQTEDCLDKISTSSHFLLGLVNDVLDMSKAESGNIELHPEPYDQTKFFSYLNSVIMPLCREKNIHFVIDARPVTDVLPMVDSLRVNQVIFNLLSNAVKFTPEGGTVTFRMREHMTDEGKLSMEGTVSDNGIGMSKEFQRVLFDPFTQESRNERTGVQGTGLGLAIVKKLLDLMGCTIKVKSEIGKGTSFIFGGEFDCVPLTAENGIHDQSNLRESVEDLHNRHVLLCEDHPLNQQIAMAILKDRGIIVQLAEDGKQGTEAFRNSSAGFYDAILMDIHMPVMDGYEATKIIRSMDREDAAKVPIIAMTADAFTEDVEKCLAAGMNAHLAKPIDPEKMVNVLKENMRK